MEKLTHKICPKCGIDKPRSDFYDRKAGISKCCKDCSKEDMKVYNQQDKKHTFRYLAKCTGLSIEEVQSFYNRKFVEQHGCCAICGTHESEHPRRLHIDHDHKTNKLRSLLCSNCNSILGLAHENTDVLKHSIEYLHKFSD